MTDAMGATMAFSRAQARLSTALGVSATGIEASQARITAAFGSMGAAVTGTADTMAVATREAAASVDVSTRTITRRLGAVTASANRAAAAVQGFGTASERIAAVPTLVGGGGRYGSAHSDMTLAQRAAVGGSLAAAGLLALGISTGAKLQDATASTATAMGIPTAVAQRDLQPIAMHMSDATAQSIADSMGLLNVMSTSGFNSRQELLGNNGALPMAIARYADTQFLGPHHVAFNQSAATAVQLAHMLGVRTSAQMTPMLNTLWKISQDMPDTVARAATQVRYFGPQLLSGGVSPTEILQLQATADRLGMGTGRGGTAFRSLYTALRSPTNPQWWAQQHLGMIDAQGHSRFINQRTGQFYVEDVRNAHGQLIHQGFLQYLNQQYDRARAAGTVGHFQTLEDHIANASTAGPLLAAFTSNAGMRQREAVRQTMQRVPDLEKAQAQLLGTLNHQFQRLTTNVSTLSAELTGPLIRPLTDFVGKLADGVGVLTNFFDAHHTARNFATAGLGVAGAVGAYHAARIGLGFGHAAAHLGNLALYGSAEGFHGPQRPTWFGTGGSPSRIGSMATAGRNAFADMLMLPNLREGAGHVLGATGRAAGATGRFLGLSSVVSMQGFTDAMAALAPKAHDASLALRGVVDLLGAGAGALRLFGTHAIPVVGEVLMLTDAIKFLGAHSKNIGKLLGEAAYWIVQHGRPLFISAIQTVWKYLIDTIKDLFGGIRDSIVGVFTGGHGGVWDWMRSVIGSAVQAYHAAGAADAAAAAKAKQSPGSHTRGAQVRAQPIGGRRGSAKSGGQVAFLDGNGTTIVHFSGPVHMDVDGADATTAHHNIIRSAYDLANRHLVKSLPTKPGPTGAGVTIADSLGVG